MTAAASSLDEFDDDAEPGWAVDAIERLSEDEVVTVLLRRLRWLTRQGVEPCQALLLASRLDLPLL